MSPCRCCGWLPDMNIPDGRLRALRMLIGPRMRSTIGRKRDVLCLECQRWVARISGIVL